MNVVYPNQKIVEVNKAPADSTHYYGVVNKEAAQRAARELTQNEMRIYLCLTLNQPNFQMVLSTSYVAQKYGGSVDGLQTAIRGLVKKGYLVKKKGNYFNFYDDPNMANQIGEAFIQKNNQGDAEKVNDESMENYGYNPGESSVEIIKKDYIENTEEYMEDLLESFSEEWDSVFEKIQIKRYPHSMKQLMEVVGYVPDVCVIKRIVDEHWSSFERKFDQHGGYRFKMLLNLVEKEYEKWKNALASEETNRQIVVKRERNEPVMDFGGVCQSRNKRRALVEIEDILDDMFDDAI